MKLNHIIRYLLFIPFFLLSLASFGYTSRAAMAREGKRPPLTALSTDVDILLFGSLRGPEPKGPLEPTESYDVQSAETHSSRSARAFKSSLSHRPSSIGRHRRSSAKEPSLNQLRNYKPSSLGAHQQPLTEKRSLNKANSQHVLKSNQFLTLLLITAILLQFGDTLAGERSSTKVDLPTGSSSPVQGSNVEGKGQVSEKSGLGQAFPESSAETGTEIKLTNDSIPERDSPVWIEFEPWLGFWIKINKGDQFVATHNFNFHRFKIERGTVGSVVDFKTEKSLVPEKFVTRSVTLDFSTDSLISECKFSEPVEEIDAARAMPFQISPFLLVSKKISVSDIKWDGNNPVEKLIRQGGHPYRKTATL